MKTSIQYKMLYRLFKTIGVNIFSTHVRSMA